MQTVDEKLNNILGIVPVIEGELVESSEEITIIPDESKEIITYDETEETIIPSTDIVPTNPDLNQDIEIDYELSRNTHKDLIDQGQEALTDLLRVAKESQHPRAYEVAGNMLKNLSDMTDKLMILHEKRKALEKNSSNQPQINIDKGVIFSGSTADLLKKIKNK